VASSKGKVAFTPEEAEQVAIATGTSQIVVKAQIHAGGRGKGTFTNGFKGGVHLVHTPAEAREIASKMLGQTLVTNQTGPEGRLVNKVLIAEAVDISRELYFAIVLDRATCAPMIIASTEGGMDIETVAEHTPEKMIRIVVDPLLGLQPYQTRKIAAALNLRGPLMTQATKLFTAMYRTFVESDCSLVEINPLVVTPDGRLLALDAKFNFDDNALYRQSAIVAMRDKAEEDPREVAASEFNLNYIGLDGNIACLVNGAGLAMATMDLVKYYGGDPANFLDIGGSSNPEKVVNAIRIITADPNVKSILFNIFGGITRTDDVANGIVTALKANPLKVPLVIRLTGTNEEIALKILKENGLSASSDMDEAVQQAVKLAAGGQAA
ncbi:MAG: ADP-forming succinate--CoA ligase subunit beta, partial [Gemmatimonadetes bacterium]|nr:ADP-forming succinate--CoA ligase subunit beta [Gemmatimonadota bacterium]